MLDRDIGPGAELLKSGIIGGIDPFLFRFPPDGAVHGARVDIGVTKAPGKHTGDSALAGTRGPVNSDDQTFITPTHIPLKFPAASCKVFDPQGCTIYSNRSLTPQQATGMCSLLDLSSQLQTAWSFDPQG
jgi:hypothetical protein